MRNPPRLKRHIREAVIWAVLGACLGGASVLVGVRVVRGAEGDMDHRTVQSLPGSYRGVGTHEMSG